VDILDCANGRGDDNRFQGTVNQWVNLPQETSFAQALEGIHQSGRLGGGEQVTLDRLGPIVRLRVEHDLLGSAGSVEVRLAAGADNIDYTATERPRNLHYRRQWANWHRADRSTGAYILELQVDVAGGNEFDIEVRCARCQRSLNPGRVIVRRRIWLIPILMEGLHVSAPDLGSFRDEFARCKLDVTTLPQQTMPSIRTIGPRESKRALLDNALAAYRRGRADRFEPFVVAALYVDQIASKMTIELTSRNFGPGVQHFLTSQNPTAPAPTWYYVWRDMGPGEQWLESAVFRDDFGHEWDVSEHCWTDMHPAHPTNDRATQHNRVNVDVDQAVFARLERPRHGEWTTAPGVLTVRVNVVRSFIGGYAITSPSSRTNVIVISTREDWHTTDANWLFIVLSHELGHKIGLVADGDRDTNVECDLDRSPMRYTGRGHTGPHCRVGIVGALSDPIQRRGECIMFGGGSDQPRSRFCDRCSRAVRKVDLPGFVTFGTGMVAHLRSIHLSFF